ncbi:siderophore-interacting protein [Streptomyces sp. SID8352]|uniref:siderophore-interacting protein n=1 Tax=Streptomyces sp. SID8352 TaxID=2690338 RepID=UPI00136F1E12|nr:siderophore-interacting protein [Streptomyces sp. SID8352]MYU25137.1 SIP domain-containing protein [Streptomyces sp. SID8352]
MGQERRGWEGAVLRLMGARDFTFTVTDTEDLGPSFRRLRLTDGGMLAATGVHPTMWVRLWFPGTGRPHQRAYTLVDPDPAAGTLTLEFALHPGRASDWARAARPSDTIGATVQGTGFQRPDPAPSHVFAMADPASLPALNSLLDAVGGAPATIWFEGDPGAGPPPRTDPARHEVRAAPRHEAGAGLVARVREELPAPLGAAAHPYVWIACDTATTRALGGYVRRELGVPRRQVHALGYWRPS